MSRVYVAFAAKPLWSAAACRRFSPTRLAAAASDLILLVLVLVLEYQADKNAFENEDEDDYFQDDYSLEGRRALGLARGVAAPSGSCVIPRCTDGM